MKPTSLEYSPRDVGNSGEGGIKNRIQEKRKTLSSKLKGFKLENKSFKPKRIRLKLEMPATNSEAL